MPSSAELELAKKDASNRIAAMTRRMKSNALERVLVHKGALAVSAALYGTLNRLGVRVDIGGFPWKIGVGGLALLGEGMTSGNWQAVLSGIADSTFAIYIERSISTNTLIAGDGTEYETVENEEEEEEEEEEDGGEVD